MSKDFKQDRGMLRSKAAPADIRSNQTAGSVAAAAHAAPRNRRERRLFAKADRKRHALGGERLA